MFFNSKMKLKDIETINDIIKKIKTHPTATQFINDIEYEKVNRQINDNELRINKGFIYEILWDICIKFGILKDFGNELEHLFVKEGKNINNLDAINKDDYKKITNSKIFEKYLKSKWISSKSGGYSDISFIYQEEIEKETEDIYVISSVKYYEEEKDVSKYDISNLCTIIHKILKDKKYKVFLFIKNKKEFIEIANKANKSSNLILRYIDYNNIYDLIDLEKHYLILRKILEEYNFLNDDNDIEKFKDEYLKIEKNKNNLIFKPKFHQKIFINKIMHDIYDKRKEDNNNFLVGAIPRTGKTYIMAGLILDYVIKNYNDTDNIYFNFLIITPAPTETISQYKEVFNDYYDFSKNNINFIAIENDNYKKDIKTNKHNVFVISIQRLIGRKDDEDIDEINENEKKQQITIKESKEESKDKSKDKDSQEKCIPKERIYNGNCLDGNKYVYKKNNCCYKRFPLNKKELIEKIKQKKQISNIEKKSPDELKEIYLGLYDDIIELKSKITKGGNKDINNIKKYLSNIKFDILFLDEAHFCLSTQKSETVINEITENYARIPNNLIRIFVTATFNKPIDKYKINANNRLFWDLNDLNELRKIISKFNDNKKEEAFKDFKKYCDDNLKKDRFKEIIDKTLKDNFNIDIKADKLKEDDNSELYFKLLLNDYKYYPEPVLLTTIWNGLDKIYNEQKLAKGLSADFNMELLFNLNKEKFVNEDQLKELFYYYLGVPRKEFKIKDEENKEKPLELNYIQQNYYKTNGIIKRIENICHNTCRTLQYKSIVSQLWFLPKGKANSSIFNICIALIKLLNQDFNSFFEKTMFIICLSNKSNKEKEYSKIYKNIKFITGSSNKTEGGVKEQIKKFEKEANEAGIYKNIVILTNGRLQLGISLNNVDIVCLFNNDKQGDRLYQMMFRSLTEIYDDKICNENNYCSHKKYGFIVDLNPQRTIFLLNYMIENMTNKKKEKEEDNKQKIVELFHIDKDFFIGNFDDENEIKKYTNQLFNKLSIDYNVKYNYIKELLNDKKFNIDDEFLIENKEILLNFTNNSKIKEYIEKRGVPDIYKSKSSSKESKDEKSKEEKSKSKSSSKENKEEKNKKREEEIKKELRNNILELISHIINISTILLICNHNDKDCYMYNSNGNDGNNDIIKEFIMNINKIKENQELKDLFIYSINNNLYVNDENKTKYDEKIFTFIDNTIRKL